MNINNNVTTIHIVWNINKITYLNDFKNKNKNVLAKKLYTMQSYLFIKMSIQDTINLSYQYIKYEK